jgi:hypothetical protein
MKHFRLCTVAALALIGLYGSTAHVRAQFSVVRWSVFDAGFIASGSRNSNSTVISAIGQPFVGSAGNAVNRINGGFLVHALGRSPATAVGDDGERELPLTYSLSQNYPNPFNPTTMIRFTVPERIHVALQVYDVLGREVASLVNEERLPGAHEVRFDARGLSSGAYFYRLRAGSYVQLKSLLILK